MVEISGRSFTSGSFFLSDLHLFSRRSIAPHLHHQIVTAAQNAHLLILGGDIFDFRWSTHPTLDSSVYQSIDWLNELISVNPSCRFHYLLGNHDCHPNFIKALGQLSQTQPQFAWHSHYLRIDETIFLHGDVIDLRLRAGQEFHQVLDSKRLSGELRDPPKPLSHTIYDMAVRARVHRMVMQLAKPNELVVRRLLKYLRSQKQTLDTGVSRVYFGHTHRRMDGFRREGMQFFNPGAAIKGLPFHLLDAHILPSHRTES